MKHQQTPRKWKDLDLNTSNGVTLSPNDKYYADLDDRFRIWDYAEITNLNSDSDAIIVLNGSIKRPLPKGTQATINHKFTTIEIINNGDSDILANEIQVNYSHQSTKEKFVNTSLSLARFF